MCVCGGDDVVAVVIVVVEGGSPPPSLFFRKPVLSVHHIKEDIQAIHMQMLRVI